MPPPPPVAIFFAPKSAPANDQCNEKAISSHICRGPEPPPPPPLAGPLTPPPAPPPPPPPTLKVARKREGVGVWPVAATPPWMGVGGKRYVKNVCMHAALFHLYSWNNYPNHAPEGTPRALQGKDSHSLGGNTPLVYANWPIVGSPSHNPRLGRVKLAYGSPKARAP